MLSVESIFEDLKQKNVQVFGICCDNADSIHTWATALGMLSFPVLADFWPHGKVCEAYGVLNENGVPDRVPILIDGDGKICYLDNAHVNEIPPLQPMLEVLARLG